MSTSSSSPVFGAIRNGCGERIDYTVAGEGKGREALVLIGHGVTGNKDRPFLAALAEELARRSIPSLRFSFSGNGSSEGRFGEATISKEVEDLRCLVDALQHRKLAYVGHSMGGAVGVSLAAREPRIRWLVSLAGMVHTARFARTEFGQAVPGEGFMWDDPDFPLSRAFMEDLEQIGSLLPLGSRIRIPWLLVHGEADDVVPIADSQDILKEASEEARLVSVPGADHVFSGEATGQMARHVGSWLEEQLGR